MCIRDRRYDESLPARALARSLGVRNRVRRISPGEFWDAVPAVQYHMDEPLADAAAVALYFLHREELCIRDSPGSSAASARRSGRGIRCQPSAHTACRYSG